MKRYLLLLCVLLLSISMKAQTYTYHYWFDSDIGQMQSGAVVNGNISLDVNSLEEGLHWLNIMLKDEIYSITERYLFFKVKTEYADASYSYWFDNDIDNMQTNDLGNGALVLDVSALDAGLHWLNIMLKRDDYSVTERYLFFKTEEQNVTSLNYWFDEEASGVHNVAFTGGTILIDVSELSIGDHILNIQLLNGSQQSVPQSYEFYRSPMARVFANPEEAGEVSVTLIDTLYTITAAANWDYTFVNWMSDNTIVSTETEYVFTTEEDVEFTANFRYNEGIDEIADNSFTLYPNPAKNNLFVESTRPISRCEIFSIDGSLLYSTENCADKMEIIVENIPSGTYIIKIDSDGLTQNRVFVKK